MDRYSKRFLYDRDIEKFPLLTIKEEVSLGERVQQGDEKAAQKLVVSNLRLVRQIAKEYKFLGVDSEDLIQEGNKGLIIASKKYDPKKGSKFSNYSAWWIKQKILRYLGNQSRTIRIPVTAYEKISKITRTYNTLQDKLGRNPTIQEVSNETKLKEKQVRIYLFSSKLITTRSLDAAIRLDMEGDNLEDVVEDESNKNLYFYPNGDKKRLVKITYNILDQLNPTQKKVITLRYGLNGSKPKKLELIGKAIKKTGERARQIQIEAEKIIKKELEKKGYSNLDLRSFNN